MSKEGAVDGPSDICARYAGSYCEVDDLESASEVAGDMYLPEVAPCRYATERFGGALETAVTSCGLCYGDDSEESGCDEDERGCEEDMAGAKCEGKHPASA